MRLALPFLRALEQIIDASPCGELTFLVTDYGRPSRMLASAIGSVTVVSKRAFPVARTD